MVMPFDDVRLGVIGLGLPLAVAHDDFRMLRAEGILRLGRDGAILFDVKSVFALGKSDGRL